MMRELPSIESATAFVRALLPAAVILFLSADATAAGSLRIACEGADVGAEVYVNGKFRGECPIDIQDAEVS
jgi:hypothetical protein